VIKYKLWLIVIGFLMLTGCADVVTFEQAANIEPVGFWYGYLHGVTIAISFIGSLFWDDIAIYAIYNNGGWYDFGIYLGILTLIHIAKLNKR